MDDRAIGAVIGTHSSGVPLYRYALLRSAATLIANIRGFLSRHAGGVRTDQRNRALLHRQFFASLQSPALTGLFSI